MSDIFKAQIAVPDTGFYWTKAFSVKNNRENMYLTSGIKIDDVFKGKYYLLDSNPVLFRQFSDLEPDPTEVRGFANKWGSFDLKASEQINIDEKDGVCYGTRIEAWRGEIRLIKKTITSLETASTADDVKSVLETINKRINILSLPSIQLNPKQTALKLILQSSGIIGVIWSQLVRFIDEQRIHLQCAHCNNWFEVQTEKRGMSKHQKFCSKNCATNSSRNKKRLK